MIKLWAIRTSGSALRTFVTAAELYGFSFGPALAQTSQIDRWSIGSWSGALVQDAQGYFERCVAAVQYQNGITFSVSLDSAGQLELRFTDDRWDLALGHEYSVGLRIDNQRVLASDIVARPTRRSQLLLTPGNNFRILALLRKGNEIEIQSDFSELNDVSLPLRDSSSALHRMAQCFPGAVPRPRNTVAAAGATRQVAMRPEANIAVLGRAIGVLDGVVESPDPNPPTQ